MYVVVVHVLDSTRFDVGMEARLKNRQGGKVKVRREERVSRGVYEVLPKATYVGKHISSLHFASSGGR